MEIINEKLAECAKNCNSFSDYEEGSATRGYNNKVKEFNERVEELIKNNQDNWTEEVQQLVRYYQNKYAEKLAFAINKSNRIESMMPSYMICGGGNFNIRKKQKQNNARDKFWQEYGDLFDTNNYYFKKIHNLLTNKTIKSDDAMAIEKLEAKIDVLTELQDKMKNVNAFYKKHGTLEDCELLNEKEIIERKRIMEMWNYTTQPYPSYELTNNSANIRRLKERLEDLKKLKERAEKPVEEKYIKIDGLEVVEDATDMRIRIIFDNIPSVEIRNILKHNGFNWSPKNSAWQRQLTANGIWSTKRVLEQLKEIM